MSWRPQWQCRSQDYTRERNQRFDDLLLWATDPWEYEIRNYHQIGKKNSWHVTDLGSSHHPLRNRLLTMYLVKYELIFMRGRATGVCICLGEAERCWWRGGTDLQPGCRCQRCLTRSQSEQTGCTFQSGFSLQSGWRGCCPLRWYEYPRFCPPWERHLWTRSRQDEAYPAVRNQNEVL